MALHITSPVAVEALRQYFELLWQRARPFGVAAPRSNGDRDRQRHEVAELLNQGFKDEAIARRLDLRPRTVRRRISEIMAELGAETRFAAGTEAQRRGWFEAESG
ncbi:LuxR C-terminal-related transcriptional regulator [Kitasatospora paranensis]|uniref:LuxR C-terminal-related transcriptional regulator n=1 Tax=Kitasatospora paranensis TaxID=258053 RepID=A0ABW2G1Y4_9ACTN